MGNTKSILRRIGTEDHRQELESERLKQNYEQIRHHMVLYGLITQLFDDFCWFLKVLNCPGRAGRSFWSDSD